MFFDATGSQDGSVVEAVEKLFACCVPTDEERRQKKPTPPLVVLHWGSLSSFPAFITSVSAKYTLFTADGIADPGACAACRWRRCPASPAAAEPDLRQRSRPPRCTGLSPATPSPRSRIAEYGDPAQWRPLAAYNGIDDPLRVRAGTTPAAARRRRRWGSTG